MRTIYFFSLIIFLLSRNDTMATSYTVSSVGFTFSPDNITIKVGDEISFELGDTHNAVEVSKATWDSNGKTSNGGFGVGFGGGKVTFNTAGTFYYVCTPHASMGMKGKIIVTPLTGIDENKNSADLELYPNPAYGFFNIRYDVTGNSGVSIDLIDITGKVVRAIPTTHSAPGTYTERLEGIPPGRYIVRLISAGQRKALVLTVLNPR